MIERADNAYIDTLGNIVHIRIRLSKLLYIQYRNPASAHMHSLEFRAFIQGRSTAFAEKPV